MTIYFKVRLQLWRQKSASPTLYNVSQLLWVALFRLFDLFFATLPLEKMLCRLFRDGSLYDQAGLITPC